MSTYTQDKDTKEPLPELITLSDDELQNIFAASCVETLAKALGVSSTEAYKRMEEVNMIDNFIYPCYDSLHTESREHVTQDLLEYLHTWGKRNHHLPRRNRKDQELCDRGLHFINAITL